MCCESLYIPRNFFCNPPDVCVHNSLTFYKKEKMSCSRSKEYVIQVLERHAFHIHFFMQLELFQYI